MRENVSNLASQVVGYKNVIGFSNFLQPRETDGVLDHKDEVIRVYVQKKERLEDLYDSWVLPSAIEDIPIDVVNINEVFAFAPAIGNDGRRDKVRPLMSGISVGHVGITAGTLGVPAEKDGVIYDCSNAHVLTPDPSKTAFIDQRILQPGKYDDNVIADKTVGRYYWHERIFPEGEGSACPVARSVVWTLNTASKILGRRSRFNTYVYGENYQDFAVYLRSEGIAFDITKTWDFDLTDYLLRARVFAGSSTRTIFCKLKYQLQAGYEPVVPYLSQDLQEGDVVRKSGRTTGDTQGSVFDSSATIRVNYGNFVAVIKDTVIASDMSAGGDSGSDIWSPV